MPKFDVIWVDKRLPNGQKRRHFTASAPTKRDAREVFEKRTSTYPELCASDNDLIVEVVELVPAADDSIKQLVTVRKTSKGHHATR